MLEDYLAFRRATDPAAKTYAMRSASLRRLESYGPLERATPDTIAAFVAAHPGNESKRQALFAARGLYRWATATGRVQQDPTAILKAPREPHRVPHPTPHDAIADGLSVGDAETRLMITAGYRAGLRISEITELHADQVSEAGLRITGKGQRSRVVPIHPDLRPLLPQTGYAFSSRTNPGRPVAPSYISRRVQIATRHTTHGLRHRFATDYYAATRDLRGLQILLGHASIATTEVYVQVADHELAERVRALH